MLYISSFMQQSLKYVFEIQTNHYNSKKEQF